MRRGKRSIAYVVALTCLTACSSTSKNRSGLPPAAERPVVTMRPPALTSEKPADYPGLHNVVAYAPGLYSGSAPDGETGFKSLAAMGIKTVISVDGAQPDVADARACGLRYVHLPIGYNGMDRERTLQIARAVKELPGPTYVHCHHGKHRSAGAAGAAAVTLGIVTPEQATERMYVSGTAPSYKGLYHCVAAATFASDAELNLVAGALPEVWKTSGLVRTMVEIDEVNDLLKAVEKAGWSTPRNHPDIVPVAEAGRLADLLRNLQDDERCKAKPREFLDQMRDASKLAESLEEGLGAAKPDPAELSRRFALVGQSCRECHTAYRDGAW